MWKLCLTSTFSELVNMSDSYHLVIHSFVHTTLLPTNPSLGGPDSVVSAPPQLLAAQVNS